MQFKAKLNWQILYSCHVTISNTDTATSYVRSHTRWFRSALCMYKCIVHIYVCVFTYTELCACMYTRTIYIHTWRR